MTYSNWRRVALIYADWRMAKILFLGFISGFPWLLISPMLSLWLKEEGISRSSIGLFGLVFGVYAINALWAPIIDGIAIPKLSQHFGQRPAWLISMQLVIALALIAIGLLPSIDTHTVWLAVIIFIIASASATQDIAIDAIRINLIGPEETEKIGAGSAMATSGWWLGFGGSKALILPLIDSMKTQHIENAWQLGYLMMIVFIVVCIGGIICFIKMSPVATISQQPIQKIPPATVIKLPMTMLKSFGQLYIAPVKAFFTRYPYQLGLAILLFIFLFKSGEAVLGRMSILFYKEIGFSLSEIGLLSGGLGTLTICLFAIFASFVNARYGLLKGIFLGGIIMAMTNLLFALLAIYPTNSWFVIAVVGDQLTTAISTVAFVAFISQLCHRQYAATQYAALASLGNLSRTVIAAGSGFLVDALNGHWPTFFILTTIMVAPSLLILYRIRHDIGKALGLG